MRVSFRFGHGGAKHNGRDFDVERAPHIDPTRMPDDRTVCWDRDPARACMDGEAYRRLFYDEHYKPYLDKINQNHMRSGHQKKCRTFSEWYDHQKRHEILLQIGDMHEHASRDELMRAALQTVAELEKSYPCFKPIYLTLHADEATPHIHMQYVMEATRPDGLVYPCKTEALRQMGIERPDISAPRSRHNHEGITFIHRCQERFQQVCMAHGLTIETEPRPPRPHLSVLAYKEQQLEATISQLEQEALTLTADRDELRSDILMASMDRERMASALQEARAELSGLQRAIEKARLSVPDSDKSMKQQALEGRIRQLERIIKHHGLDPDERIKAPQLSMSR